MKEKEVLIWKNIKPVYCSPEKITELIEEFEQNPDLVEYKNTKGKGARRNSLFWGSWGRICADDRTELRIYPFDGEPQRYIWLRDKVINHDDFIIDEFSGLDAFNFIQNNYKKRINTKKGLFAIFSGKKYTKEYNAIKQCVPVQIQYLDKQYKGKTVKHCTKADVSSAFPAQMLKDLPTLHDCITVQGKSEPNEQYPFAFYTKSHHIKSLDGIDTTTLNSVFYFDYYTDKYDDTIKDKDEITILCKSMKKDEHDALADAFKDLYEHRKEDEKLKFFMNACIGYFQLNADPRLSFISAVVIARCNQDMIKRSEALESRGNRVLFIATDSICWKGGEDIIATNDKYLGSFTYEGKDISFKGFSPKAYQWIDSAGKCTTKYSGMKKAESALLKFGELNYKADLERSRYLHDTQTGKMLKLC